MSRDLPATKRWILLASNPPSTFRRPLDARLAPYHIIHTTFRSISKTMQLFGTLLLLFLSPASAWVFHPRAAIHDSSEGEVGDNVALSNESKLPRRPIVCWIYPTPESAYAVAYFKKPFSLTCLQSNKKSSPLTSNQMKSLPLTLLCK